MFYINTYIDWDYFNLLYDLGLIEKSTQNTDVIAYKFRPALIRATNHKLKDAKKEKQKTEEIVERRKTEVLAAKHCRARKGISLSSTENGNYENDIEDDTDPDQADDKYPLQL